MMNRWAVVTLLLTAAALAMGPPPRMAVEGNVVALAQGTEGGTEQTSDPELEAQVHEIASKLRCPTCRALSVEDSPSGMAQEMQDLIREQLQAGKTPDEVTAYFVERYGEWILLEPKAEGFNWTVWLLPVLLLIGGLAFVLLTARRWVQQGRQRAAAFADKGAEVDR